METKTAMPGLVRWLSDSGTTQDQLAGKLGVTAPAISHYVTGRHRPSLDRLLALSRITGLSIDDLLGRTPGDATQGSFQH